MILKPKSSMILLFISTMMIYNFIVMKYMLMSMQTLGWFWKFQVPLTMDTRGMPLQMSIWILMMSMSMSMEMSMLFLGDVHHECYDGWIIPENFRFLSQCIAEIWSFIPVNVHFDIDDVLVDVHGDEHVVHVDAYDEGYKGLLDLESSRLTMPLLMSMVMSELMLIIMGMMDELVLKISYSYHNG